MGKLINPHKFLADRFARSIKESEEGKLFGEQIDKINNWLKNQTEYDYDDFVWDGKELKLLDKQEKVIDTLNLSIVKSKIPQFPEKA